MKRLNYLILSALLALCAGCGGGSLQAQKEVTNDSILAIRKQGSFLIGGSIKTQPGTYDTRQPLKADGQTLHGDHAYVSYQSRSMPAKIRLYSCTEPDNPPRRGKVRPTVVRAFLRFSCAGDSVST